MKKTIIGLSILLFGLSISSTAQLSKDSKINLDEKQDSLIKIGYAMLNDTNPGKRIDALHKFIPILTRALKIDESFYYPFDSLTCISSLYAPDSTFRILSWQLYLGKGMYRYYGTIQMQSDKLKMFPLFDTSDSMTYHIQDTLNQECWLGQLYYKIIKTYALGRNCYILFGYDGYDLFGHRKIADVLWFNQGYPRFGLPIFKYKYKDGHTATSNRIFLDYKFNAIASMNYDTTQHLIVYDHTEPEDSSNIGLGFTYVPDGTYEGFKYEGGFWNWVEKVFTFAINENDNPPVPEPVFDKTKDNRFK
jgi:hypothetical protein